MGAADEEHNKLIAENASNIEKLELLIEKYNDAQIKTNEEDEINVLLFKKIFTNKF